MAAIWRGVRGLTGVRHISSKCRMVSLSIAPASCRPSAVSCIAAKTGLRYRFFAGDFFERAVTECEVDGFVLIVQHPSGEIFQSSYFISFQIVLHILCKAENEKGH